MTYKGVIERNRLEGDYLPAEHTPYPNNLATSIRGDLRRLELDQRDPGQLVFYARLAGITTEQAKIVLDAFFEGDL